jgi:hypothetical protein
VLTFVSGTYFTRVTGTLFARPAAVTVRTELTVTACAGTFTVRTDRICLTIRRPSRTSTTVLTTAVRRRMYASVGGRVCRADDALEIETADSEQHEDEDAERDLRLGSTAPPHIGVPAGIEPSPPTARRNHDSFDPWERKTRSGWRGSDS